MTQTITTIDTQYQTFDARAYLQEYYSGIIVDEQWLLEFLIEHLKHQPMVQAALDCGSGPVVSHLLPLATKASEIHVAEYLAANRDEINLWRDQSPSAYDWSVFTQEILRLEGEIPTAAAIAHREQLTRERVTAVLGFDARDPQPLGKQRIGYYPLVTAHYCADCISPDVTQWREYVSHIMGLVAPGGTLIMSASGSNVVAQSGTFYRVIDQCFPQTRVTPENVLACFRENGFENVDLRVRQLPDAADQGYDCLIFVCGHKS